MLRKATNLTYREIQLWNIRTCSLFVSDLVKDDYTFGRGDDCDISFSSTGKRLQFFQACSKIHFKLIRVSIEQLVHNIVINFIICLFQLPICVSLCGFVFLAACVCFDSNVFHSSIVFRHRLVFIFIFLSSWVLEYVDENCIYYFTLENLF